MKNTVFNKFPKQPYTIYNVVRCFISFFNYWGTANWYQVIDKPTLWQRIYKCRIGPKTAWTLAHGIWLEGYSYASWINSDLYPDGKIYTQEYTQWLERQVLALREPESQKHNGGYSLTPFQESIKLLRDLADLQNGAPLEQHRHEWEDTMQQIYDFLEKWKG